MMQFKVLGLAGLMAWGAAAEARVLLVKQWVPTRQIVEERVQVRCEVHEDNVVVFRKVADAQSTETRAVAQTGKLDEHIAQAQEADAQGKVKMGQKSVDVPTIYYRISLDGTTGKTLVIRSVGGTQMRNESNGATALVNYLDLICP